METVSLEDLSLSILDRDNKMSLEKYVDYLVSFLKDYARPFNGYILGVSGGLDSALQNCKKLLT